MTGLAGSPATCRPKAPNTSAPQCKVGRVRALLTIYLMGVLVGLWRTDGPPATKLRMALLWPIGPLAFVVTVSGLVVAAAIAFVGPGRKTT